MRTGCGRKGWGWWCAVSAKSTAPWPNCSSRPTISRFRDRAAAIENRAVFEIPDILERILCESQPLP